MSGRIRKALLNRETTIGSWIQLGAYPAVAEILAEAGYRWLGIDCEHSDIDVQGFTSLARAVHGHGPEVLARVRENDTLAIRQVLDAGADGIIVPLVNTAQEAEKAVAAAKYPPAGIRGFCFSRMNNYGNDFKEYAGTANENIAVVVMVESKQAVENISEIISVEGVDGVFIGPYDMSGSYGLTGRVSHPVIRRACRQVISACESGKKSVGLHLVNPTRAAIRRAATEGFNFIALGADAVFLNGAARHALKYAERITGG